MSEEKLPPFKNTVIVDVDSEREENVLLGKPDHWVAPSTKDAMKQVLMTDLTTLCEGVVTVANLIEKEGFHTKEKVLNFTIAHLQNAIPNTECKLVEREDEPNEETKEAIEEVRGGEGESVDTVDELVEECSKETSEDKFGENDS